MAFAYRLPVAAMQQGTVVRRRLPPPICGDVDTTLLYGVSALIRPPHGMIAASPMVTPHTLHRYSFEDYLAVEQVSTVKHEFLGGGIYAMAGGSVLHAALSAAKVATIDYDLGEKGEHYKQIRRQIELRERTPDGWRTEVCGAGATCTTESLGVRIDVDALYAAAGS